jgi:hypothetical protein
MTHTTNPDPSAPLATDSLIAALTADLPTRPTSIGRAIMIALAVGVPLGALIMATGIVPVRSDFFPALLDARFSFKFVFTLAALVAGLWLCVRVLRPGTQSGPANFGLAAAVVILAAGVVTEMSVLPMQNWRASWLGFDALKCVLLIPLLSVAPLVTLLYTLRAGAPDSPTLAGASAGLIAAGIGATFYGSHCINDSPLFVATWYVIGMAVVVATGALVGSRVLRW